MICRAIPYEGKEPYIFLSYCHKDAETVYPLLEQMVSDGCRIWYDDGNHAGDDWLENIANHLNNCTICLAMISERSSASHNCKSEINEAIAWGKKLVPVLLENFRMPLGMRLQLSEFHYLKKTEYPSDQMLLQKLYETESFVKCKATPGSIQMRAIDISENDVESRVSSANSSVAEYIASESTNGKNKKPSVVVSGDTPSALSESVQDSAESGVIDVKKKKSKAKIRIKIALDKNNPNPVVQEPSQSPLANSSDDDPETVFDNETRIDSDNEEDETPTVWAAEKGTAILVQLSTGKAFPIQSALTRIGRSEKRCDIVISDNAYIGNCHAEIIEYKHEYYLRDLNSANGTFANGSKLSPEEKVVLCNSTIFQLHSESFMFICDAMAEQIVSQNVVYFLRNTKTQGVKFLSEGTLLLDRGHKWEDGTLSDEKISRSNKHASITCKANELWLEDLGSRNGTYLNGHDIRGKEAQHIEIKDKIRLGDTVLEVGIITLQGERT